MKSDQTQIFGIQPHDHVMGKKDAPIKLIEYADFECPYSAIGAEMIADLRETYEDKICYIYRHFPLNDIHDFAETAAVASEAAAKQKSFWKMHNFIFLNQDGLELQDIHDYVEKIGLNLEQFKKDMESAEVRERVQYDLRNGESLGVDSTPTFFINGKRYEGHTELASLSEAIESALNEGQNTAA